MKNKVFAFAALVAVALAACQEEPKEQGSKEIKATISAEGLSWSSGDAIGLYEKKDPFPEGKGQQQERLPHRLLRRRL